MNNSPLSASHMIVCALLFALSLSYLWFEQNGPSTKRLAITKMSVTRHSESLDYHFQTNEPVMALLTTELPTGEKRTHATGSKYTKKHVIRIDGIPPGTLVKARIKLLAPNGESALCAELEHSTLKKQNQISELTKLMLATLKTIDELEYAAKAPTVKDGLSPFALMCAYFLDLHSISLAADSVFVRAWKSFSNDDRRFLKYVCLQHLTMMNKDERKEWFKKELAEASTEEATIALSIVQYDKELAKEILHIIPTVKDENARETLLNLLVKTKERKEKATPSVVAALEKIESAKMEQWLAIANGDRKADTKVQNDIFALPLYSPVGVFPQDGTLMVLGKQLLLGQKKAAADGFTKAADKYWSHIGDQRKLLFAFKVQLSEENKSELAKFLHKNKDKIRRKSALAAMVQAKHKDYSWFGKMSWNPLDLSDLWFFGRLPKPGPAHILRSVAKSEKNNLPAVTEALLSLIELEDKEAGQKLLHFVSRHPDQKVYFAERFAFAARWPGYQKFSKSKVGQAVEAFVSNDD